MIPIYNHPATVAAVVAGIRRYGLPVILIDDGGNAECARVLAHIAASDDDVSLITRQRNGGKGSAVMTGARAALARGYSHMLQIDADGQHDTAAIPAALAQVEHTPRAFVMGVPVFNQSMPRSRRYGRWLTHALVWLDVWTLAIRDAMCGFRIYPLIELVALANRQRLGQRMDFDIEVAVRLVWDDVPVAHVDVGVHYPADGISHFDLWADNVLITRMHARLLGGMLIRAPLLLVQRLRGLFKP